MACHLILKILFLYEIINGMSIILDKVTPFDRRCRKHQTGQYIDFRFMNASSKPERPSSGTEALGSDWLEAPENPADGSGMYTWVIQSRVNNGIYDEWSDPFKLNGAVKDSGKAISGITPAYYVGDKITDNTSWSDNMPTLVEEGKSLWTKLTITYTDDSSPTDFYIKAYQGKDGKTEIIDGTNPDALKSITDRLAAVEGAINELPEPQEVDLSDYAKKSDLTGLIDAGTLENYYTKESVDGLINDIELSEGKQGRGISNVVTTYQTGTSGSTVPTGTWLSSVPTVEQGKYLWTRIYTTYTDGKNPTTIYLTSYQGKDGSNATIDDNALDELINGKVAPYQRRIEELEDALNSLREKIEEGPEAPTPSTDKVDPDLKFSSSAVEATLGDSFTEPTLSNKSNVPVTYSSTNTDVATVNASTGKVTLLGAGITYIQAVSTETLDYNSKTVQYKLTVQEAADPGPVDETPSYVVTQTRPTAANLSSLIDLNGSKPTEAQTIDMTSNPRPNDFYLVYPLEWEEMQDGLFIKPVITDWNGFEVGFDIDEDTPTLTVDGTVYRVMNVNLGKGTYHISF